MFLMEFKFHRMSSFQVFPQQSLISELFLTMFTLELRALLVVISDVESNGILCALFMTQGTGPLPATPRGLRNKCHVGRNEVSYKINTYRLVKGNNINTENNRKTTTIYYLIF